MGDLLLWTNFECGLGIVAGSLPMLRKLFKSLAGSENDNGNNNNPDISLGNLVTIGGGGGVRSGKKFSLSKHPYEADITVLATVTGPEEELYRQDGDEALDLAKEGDDESTRQMIRVTRRIERNVSVIGQNRETDRI